MAKLLPIKFFEKRRRDELRTEGGGSNTIPKWQLNGNALSEHAQELQDGVSELSAAYDDRKKEDHELPMVMVTTINEEAIAKLHRAEVVNLLNSDGNQNVIGLETELHVEPPLDSATAKKENDEPDLHETRMLLSIVTSDELLANINRKLQDTQGSAKLISSITGMKVFEGRAGIYNPDNKAYRVVLIDYQDTSRNLLAQRVFRNQCSANGMKQCRKMHLQRLQCTELHFSPEFSTAGTAGASWSAGTAQNSVEEKRTIVRSTAATIAPSRP